MKKTPELEIVIPVRNEAAILDQLLLRIDTTLKKAGITYHCTAIDDHSTDKSWLVLQKLSKKYPLRVVKKKGVQGKAYSILQVRESIQAAAIVLLDADLQYPPEVIPALYKEFAQSGLVVTRRNFELLGSVRELRSALGRTILGKLLYNFDYDALSGLKIVHKDILSRVRREHVSPQSLDLPLIDIALELGYVISEVSVLFNKRTSRTSQRPFLLDALNVFWTSLTYLGKHKTPLDIVAEGDTMVGAGLHYHRRSYITHTTLDHNSSAIETFTFLQKLTIMLLLGLTIGGLIWTGFTAAIVIVAILSTIYFLDVFFNLFLIIRSLHSPPEITITPEEIASLKDRELPTYTILCPLYKEAHILPFFLKSIEKLDWPKSKLDVQLLLEADDEETISLARKMKLPAHIRIVVVPDSEPKTKPKACNYGLNKAKGEYVVIYDAEDMPDPDQLKKVYLAFTSADPTVKCVQAKLNYYNPHQNWLTRFFTAEYSLWFDVILTGLQSIGTTIPLGGTSNHFRKKDLLALQGWDPFNVTEDCDLGVRLFSRGAKTAIIDSVTLEEANSDWKNWLRQRSRWIKGYMQTYLLHMRNPWKLLRSQGIHAVIFQLSVGGKIAFMLINPILWALTIAYFVLFTVVGPTIEALYPTVIFYMAVTSLVFGNFMFIYYYMIGVAKREHWSVMKYVLLVPFYWLMTSVAAGIALYELIVRPHYWQKTEHGLHLKEDEKEAQKKPKKKQYTPKIKKKSASLSQKVKSSFFNKNRLQISGLVLIIGTVISNVLNLSFNAHLSNVLTLVDFGNVSFFSSLMYLSFIPLLSLSSAVSYKVGFTEGKYGTGKAYGFWRLLNWRVTTVAVLASVIWLLLISFLGSFFQVSDNLLLYFFTPMLFLGAFLNIDRGFLSGVTSFVALSILLVLESVTKFVTSILFVAFGAPSFAYLAFPLGLLVALIFSRTVILHQKSKSDQKQKHTTFPSKYYMATLISGLAKMSFLSVDMLLVKHYMAPEIAGQYAVISLVGKMVFFAGTLASQFVVPLVSRREGEGKGTKRLLYLAVAGTATFSGLASIVFGYFGAFFLPFILGEKVLAILDLLPLFSLGMFCFITAQVFVSYYLIKKIYVFALLPMLLTVVQIAGMMMYHSALEEVVAVMTVVGALNLILILFLHSNVFIAIALQNNFLALLRLFKRSTEVHKKLKNKKLRILFFNWRDTKHIWAGGAETYVQNVAVELVKDGHKVTIFCGSDGKSPIKDTINGVQIIRRGGFFTVYIWAFLYYIVQFRSSFDLIIDSENGVPFFTPLFVTAKKFLLIHHVHQDVFQEHLPFPFSKLAQFIEKGLMPSVYASTPVITVSKSSKREIAALGFHTNQIHIVHPGVTKIQSKVPETDYPSVLYLGRLKPYKNIDTAVLAFKKVLHQHPDAVLTIAGEGESEKDLKRLVYQLKLEDKVQFYGKVSEQKKADLFSSSWIVVQPSEIEGWGITVIESNSYKTPVIASNVSGLKDSVIDGETGILVKPKDADQLADTIVQVIENEELRHSLSHSAYQWSKKFHWREAAQKIVDVYRCEFEHAAGQSYEIPLKSVTNVKATT